MADTAAQVLVNDEAQASSLKFAEHAEVILKGILAGLHLDEEQEGEELAAMV